MYFKLLTKSDIFPIRNDSPFIGVLSLCLVYVKIVNPEIMSFLN